MELLKFTLALFPFLVFIYLLLVSKKSLLLSSLAFCLSTFLIATIIWQIKTPYIYNSIIKAGITSLDIFLIIIGSLAFLGLLQKNKTIDSLIIHLESVSADYRIQTILLCWFLENFIEGIAGFGTPTTIVAPILLSLGYSPTTAVVLSLLGNSTSVAFGAAGTPIRTGFATVLNPSIPSYTAAISSIGFLVPIFMLWVATRGRVGQNNQFLSALPFAIWSGLVFVVSSWLSLVFGPEFPSIIGSLLAVAIIILSLKIKLFTPPTIIPFSTRFKKNHPSLPVFQTVIPYLLVIILLIVSKIFLGSLTLPLFQNQSHSFSLANPGFAFVITIAILLIFKSYRQSFSLNTITSAFKISFYPILIIFAMATSVQLLTLSQNNLSGYYSIMDVLTSPFSSGIIFFWAPFLGAFGSFMTGSATVSNIMFGQFLEKIAISLDRNPAILLSLQLVGAAAGNMIALADMMVAQTVVHLKNQEVSLLKKLLIPCLFILFLTGLIGLII